MARYLEGPRYLETAGKANEVAKAVIDLVPEAQRPYVACLLAQLVNLGVRCAPRGVQHTIRYNAVQRAMRGLPVKVGMKEVRDEKTTRTFNALTTEPVGVENPTATVEGNSGDEE